MDSNDRRVETILHVLSSVKKHRLLLIIYVGKTYRKKSEKTSFSPLFAVLGRREGKNSAKMLFLRLCAPTNIDTYQFNRQK